ncbi:MAG: ATP-binding protein [Acidimicrobiia bacterium]|nr:ATP-binding protein [Acidimicrobiia bacterium]
MGEDTKERPVVGRVIGTEDSTPLEFWVAVGEGQYLQLDDVVALERVLPGGELVAMYGMVSQVRARHEGARFDTDVFLIEDGILPAEVAESAKISATRFEPETFVPPRPGQAVRRAEGEEREKALFFDQMTQRLPIGLSRSGEPLFVNLEFLDGQRGAHVNISGISGVATKTSYATFLLHSIFTSGVLGQRAVNTKALIFNVKGEDLLFLDRPNAVLDADAADRYRRLGLAPEPFSSLSVYAPPRQGSVAAPDVYSRTDGAVTSFFWTLAEFCKEDLLPFLFADAEDDRAQYTMVVHNVMARLRRAVPLDDGGVSIEGESIRTFADLASFIQRRVTDDETRYDWAGPAIGQGTVNAFVRRLLGSVRHVERLIRGDVANAAKHQVELDAQVTVVDIHNLNDRAKRFVVGVTIRRQFEMKERAGQSEELLFLVLDELNKYAPRDGWSPIKEILLDVAERGRSLGVVLVGAQQTASEIERRIIANSSIRVVGRLDSAEAAREEYGFLPSVQRQRSTILKPGTMIVSQPELPVPLVLEFPFPAWATRASEAVAASNEQGPEDPFEGLDAPR